MAKKITRVCFLNPQGYVTHPAPLGKTDTGGQTLYVLELAKALAEKGVKVDIFVRKFDELVNNENPWPGVNIIRIPCGDNKFIKKEDMYNYMPEFVENIVQYATKTRKKYDLIHSHYWDGGYAGISLAKIIKIPHIHTPHSLGKLKKLEMNAQQAPVKKLAPIYRYHVRIAVEQKIMNKADAIIVICETSRIQIFEHYIVDFEKVHVRFPGIDTNYYSTKKTRFDKKNALAKNSVLTVSRLVPAKGLDRVIEALALIKNKVNFHLYIAGGLNKENLSKEEQVTHKQLQLFIEKHRLTKKVSLIGFVNHEKVLPAIYRSADIFILAGRYEPFGLTTLEAMACGTAPVVSSIAGSREVIIDGLNGFIVDTSNRKALSETILKLLTNKKLKNKISENAAFTIKEHYSWNKISQSFINLYKKYL